MTKATIGRSTPQERGRVTINFSFGMEATGSVQQIERSFLSVALGRATRGFLFTSAEVLVEDRREQWTMSTPMIEALNLKSIMS